jgi:aminobenzoyl-glutamate utilization protein B
MDHTGQQPSGYTTRWLKEHANQFTEMSDRIWQEAETAWQEHNSSRIQSEYLLERGFSLTSGIADIPTAFSAEWGSGKPVIGFVGEYDALPGLSQKAVPYKEPVAEGAPGHGCGHNLLGTGCLAAAEALRWWLEEQGSVGTVRYYGCPAEEQISAKAFMARTGCFDDLDAAFNYHPSKLNMPGKGTAVGVVDASFRFKGITSHAGGSPEKGRSALDAVELMNVGVNYLREHVADKVRIHYTITDGGMVPNIVPETASVWYFVRAPERKMLDDVFARVRKVAEGAALMTETEVAVEYRGACSSVLNNHYLADLQFQAMKQIGPIEFTDAELDFAEKINRLYASADPSDLFGELKIPADQKERVDRLYGAPLIGENFPSMDAEVIGTGSTDVGDVSWITPLSMLETACFPTGAAGHSWGIAATSGMSIGHKGMLHAAATMALTAVRLYSEPTHLEMVRREFRDRTEKVPYVNPIPEGVNPPTP